MGKKTSTLSPASPARENPAHTPSPAASPIPPSEPAEAAESGPGDNGNTAPTSTPLMPSSRNAKPAAKATAKLAGARKAAPKRTPAPKHVTLLTEDIALRAYFISEHRRHHGIHGDQHSDWVEAERQLNEEQLGKKPGKKSAPARKKKN